MSVVLYLRQYVISFFAQTEFYKMGVNYGDYSKSDSTTVWRFKDYRA